MKKRLFSTLIAVAMIICLAPVTYADSAYCKNCLKNVEFYYKSMGDSGHVKCCVECNKIINNKTSNNGSYKADSHVMTNFVYNNDATCGKDGTKTKKCTLCSYSVTEKDPDHKATNDHEYSTEWTTSDTDHWHTCIKCNEAKSDEGAHVDTNPIDHKCDVCGKELSKCADDNNDHNCDVCGKELSRCADGDNDHNCDVCGKELSKCADENKDHKCDVCGKELSKCADDNKDHNCDYCGKELSTCADGNNDHNCDVCGTVLSRCADENKDHKCDVCGKELSKCADENKDHKCDVCGKELSKCDENLEKVDKTDATTSAAGNIEYWHCTICGKFFSDEKAKEEIANGIDGTVIPKLPVIINGNMQSVTEGEKKALSFTSDAEYDLFEYVLVDEEELDPMNYAVAEGSTIVTLKGDYVAALSVGDHTLSIVSNSGTATANFTVNKKAVKDSNTNTNTMDNVIAGDDQKVAQTDDNNNIAPWLVLLFASGSAVTATTVGNKKRKYNR